jgi:DNA-binding XRE family transcriptional regulator
MSKMEIAIVAKAKQGYIYRHMIENGLSIQDLSDRIGITRQTLYAMINFRWLPPEGGKNKRVGAGYSKKMKTVYKLQKYFNVGIDVLFPPELTEEIAEKLRGTHVDFREVDFLQIEHVGEKYLSYDPQQIDGFEEMADGIPRMLCTLNLREEKVLRLRYGIGGERDERDSPIIDIPPTMMKLRNPSRRRRLAA